MAKKYLALTYLKYFFIILFALVLFFVGLDFLQAMKSLPKSANLQFLYILYRALSGIDLLFPISLVFALIALKVHLIRSNELVALYALGYSKKDVLRPLFGGAMLLTLLYLLLHFTSFAYAKEYAENIKQYSSIQSTTKDLYFKYNDRYVYFQKLYPLQKRAANVRVFDTNGTHLERVVIGQEAFFRNNTWHIPRAKIVQNLGDHIAIRVASVDTLQGYKPKILDSVYEGKTSMTLLDAIYAIKLFLHQNIDVQKLKAVLYYNLFYPFFAPLLMLILFYFVPLSSRIGSVNLFSFAAIAATLFVWGFLYVLIKLAFNGTLQPEIAILLPIFFLFVAALWFYKRF